MSDLITRMRADERIQHAIARVVHQPGELESIACELARDICQIWPEADEEGRCQIRDICAVALSPASIYRVRVSRLHDIVIPPEPPLLPGAGVLVPDAESHVGMLAMVGWYHGTAGLRVITESQGGVMVSARWPCILDNAEPMSAALANTAARALAYAAPLIHLPA